MLLNYQNYLPSLSYITSPNVPTFSQQPAKWILLSSPVTPSTSSSAPNQEPSTPRRVYTTSSTAAAAAGRRVNNAPGRGGGRSPPPPNRGSSNSSDRRPPRSGPPAPRNFGTRGPAPTGEAANGLPPLTLVNPLRISRIVEQTPGTSEEIYAEKAPPRNRDGDGASRGGGRGARPVASAGGIGT